MATHSSIRAWRIPWTEEPGGLQSTGLQRVEHDQDPERALSTQVSCVCVFVCGREGCGRWERRTEEFRAGNASPARNCRESVSQKPGDLEGRSSSWAPSVLTAGDARGGGRVPGAGDTNTRAARKRG